MDPTFGLIALGTLALGASVRWNWWRLPKEGLPVLMYHKIGEPPERTSLKKLWVSEKDFRRQMKYLLERGYTPVTLAELRDFIQGKKPLPPNPVMVTLDDGYQNNYTCAFPVLEELKVKANVFLVYETVGRHNAWHNPDSEPWLKMLTWPQVEEMERSGLVEFASHTMRHSNLLEIPPEEVRWEVEESKKRMEDKMGREMFAFAYPYGAGAYDPRVREKVLKAGYSLDFSIRQGKTPLSDLAQKPIQRLLIRWQDDPFDFFLNLTRGKSHF